MASIIKEGFVDLFVYMHRGAAALSAVCQARGSGRTGTCCVWRQLHSGWNNNLSPSWVKLFMKSNTVQAVYCAGGLSATSHTPNKHMTNDSNTTTEETNWSWCLYGEQTSNQSSILADTFMKPYTTLICLNQSSDRFWIRLNVSAPLWFAPQPDVFSTRPHSRRPFSPIMIFYCVPGWKLY